MKRPWIILTTLILIESDILISKEEQRKDWFNSLVEGKYIDGENSTIIKKNDKGNIIIESISGTSFCTMEYDSTGSLVMQWTGTILTSK